MIPDGSSVSFGGSMTFEETGMYDSLKDSTLHLIDRNLATTPEEKNDIVNITLHIFCTESLSHLLQ